MCYSTAMISQLSGQVTHKDSRFLILDVGGVGYKVFATGEMLEKLPAGKNAKLWTYLAVREDALDLYGFLEKEGLDFFELLISISGIGPKSALSILNLATLPTLHKAIASGDASYLTKVSGIGRRNAEKIVLELKDKLIVVLGEGEKVQTSSQSDALEALKSLGYSEREARDALKKVSSEITDTGECVKAALKVLSKQN